MRCNIFRTQPKDELWQHIERYSPQTVGYLADPNDHSDYRCFVALNAQGRFIGLSIVAIGHLGFGPLADQIVGCLENILVSEPCRREGIGRSLFHAALDTAWHAGARHVWWTIDYENTPAIAFYLRNGALFIAEEDPDSERPEQYYTAVVANPHRGGTQTAPPPFRLEHGAQVQ